MSAQNSNLSDPASRYDLVSAVTQSALNANLKQFWDILGGKTPPVTVYYKYKDAYHDSGTVEMTEEEVLEMTGGQDIFTIPDGTRKESEEYRDLGDKMASMDFAYAFQAGLGRPSGIAPADMPDIISLSFDSSRSSGEDLDQTVQYSLYFGSFSYVKLTYSNNVWSVKNVSQTDTNPWIWQWLVNLNLEITSGKSFDSLPENIQSSINAVYNCNPKSMFSLQQLLLDLNTFEMVSGLPPSVLGLDPDDTLCAVLNGFVNNYWLSLVHDIGTISLNSSVTPEEQDYPPSSIVPSDLNFVVSPYSDNSEHDLYTLNYLVMSDQNAMPASIQPFAWNWVDSKKIQGIMSVRKDLFLDFLNQALSPSLTDLCLTVNIAVDTEEGYFKQGDITVSLTPNDAEQQKDKKYVLQSQKPWLSYCYQSRKEDTDLQAGFLFIPKGMKLIADLKVNSDIYLYENTIQCKTTVSMYFEYDIDGSLSKTKGYPIAQQNVTTFSLTGVGTGTTPENSTAGVLLVSSTTAVTDLAQTEDKDGDYYNGDYDPSIVANIMSAGAVKGLKENVDEIKNNLATLMDGYTAQVSKLLNGSFGFVFPGAQTYFFSNPTFSDNGDLTVEVAFQIPS